VHLLVVRFFVMLELDIPSARFKELSNILVIPSYLVELIALRRIESTGLASKKKLCTLQNVFNCIGFARKSMIDNGYPC